MIYCEIGGQSDEELNNLAVFVRQLRQTGFDAAIHADAVQLWDGPRVYHVYDIAPLLTDRAPQKGDHLIMVNATALTDGTLAQLRRRFASADMTCTAYGEFSTTQTEIGVRIKLNYALGVEPEMVNSASVTEPFFCLPVPVIGVSSNSLAGPAEKLPRLMLFGPNLESKSEQMALKSLARTGRVVPVIMTNAAGKQAWKRAHGNEIPCYQYGEALPDHMSQDVDVLVAYQNSKLNYRGKSMIANLARSGAVLLDGSNSGCHTAESEVFISTAQTIETLQDHLFELILPHREQIRADMLKSSFSASVDPAKVLIRLSVTRSSATSQKAPSTRHKNKPQRSKLIYHPTNGVGLGHAQRCSLVAAEHDRKKIDPVFAAFPSCVPMLQGYGNDTIPLVSRSKLHKTNFASDLMNYSRLQAVAADAAGFVFDGGFIFDSVYRTLKDREVPGVWIRRGMWQDTQDNSMPLDREKFFKKVIVPTEAFEELNQSYSLGSHIHTVGPIAQKTQMDTKDKRLLRESLAKRFDTEFDHLVVTMLGGGVAANRAPQLQALCGMMERRPRTLHLIVVWPTATIEPVAFDWRNSHVVKTHYAASLAASSDLFISAVGYNSFHEVLYNQIPAIFMPQMSAMMDDQGKRASAAVERELAAMVEPDNLIQLGSEVSNFLDHGKADRMRTNLRNLVLPETGNAMAARLIEELI